MRKIFFLLPALCLLLTSCGASRRVSTDSPQSWRGHSTADILVAMGEPERIDTDGKGGSILIYESEPDYDSPDYDILAPEASAQTRTYAHFYLDDEGDCYRVDTNRSLPVPSKETVVVHGSVWLDLLITIPLLLISITI